MQLVSQGASERGWLRLGRYRVAYRLLMLQQRITGEATQWWKRCLEGWLCRSPTTLAQAQTIATHPRHRGHDTNGQPGQTTATQACSTLKIYVQRICFKYLEKE